ncbi:hypothetical protein GMOD_00004954 [Pyrenophora seminiperda CCB06]|uniref:Uncharacterized protein n=1 Tax=Pyrenophora seminiperda CCB06 TaxID=1302712 RepID=A0A3M7MHV8_9PLEO|nr:hypothetical protein GMOD_00004954 [Pyrenophora seminiperda CCB06]
MLPNDPNFRIAELQKQTRDLGNNYELYQTANEYLSDMRASKPSVSTNSRPTKPQAMKRGKTDRKIVSQVSKDSVRKRERVAPKPQKCAPELTLRSRVPVRSFYTEVYWGGVAVTACPKFPLSSNIRLLPKASMSLWELVGWLTNCIDGNNGHGATEEKAALQEISEWAAKIHGHLDADNTQRRIFLVSLIGKQVKLKSGADLKLIGMSGDEFVVQDTEGVKYIMGEHVELENVQPHASV